MSVKSAFRSGFRQSNVQLQVIKLPLAMLILLVLSTPLVAQSPASQQPNSRTDASQSTDQPNSNPSKDRNPNQINASSSAHASIDMMQLQREMAQQCLTDSKQYLGKKEGAEFDKCFVGMQIAKHAAMHSKLVVLQRHTSDELQQIVAEGIQTTAKHLKEAETLMTKLDANSSVKLSSKSGK